MKSICHLITTIDRGGAENQLLTLVEQQIEMGIRVEVIPLKGMAELQQDFEKLGAIVNLELINKSPFQQFVRLRKYRKSIAFLLHAHLPRAELIALASQIWSTEFIVTRHNAEAFFPTGSPAISGFLSRMVLRQSNYCVCISEAVRDFIIEAGEVPRGMALEVVHYGYKRNHSQTAEIQRFMERNPTFSTNGLVFGTIARLAYQKDIETLLGAFARYLSLKSNESTQLLIIGSGPLKDRLQVIAHGLGISENVFWAGRIKDVHGFLEIMDTFILTSRYEGFGLVLLEALDHSLRIIAANNSAIPEVLGQDYEFLFDTGNTTDLLNKMQRIQMSNFDFQEFARNRLKLFEAKVMSARIQEIYLRCRSFQRTQ